MSEDEQEKGEDRRRRGPLSTVPTPKSEDGGSTPGAAGRRAELSPSDARSGLSWRPAAGRSGSPSTWDSEASTDPLLRRAKTGRPTPGAAGRRAGLSPSDARSGLSWRPTAGAVGRRPRGTKKTPWIAAAEERSWGSHAWSDGATDRDVTIRRSVRSVVAACYHLQQVADSRNSEDHVDRRIRRAKPDSNALGATGRRTEMSPSDARSGPSRRPAIIRSRSPTVEAPIQRGTPKTPLA